MSTFGRSQWLMLGGAVVVTGLLLLAPRTPDTKSGENAATEGSARVSEDPNSGSTPHAEGASAISTDPEVNAILGELASGGPPMQTILKLRALADKDPQNVEAQYHLGMLSWETKQYEKAMARFQKVIALDPKGYPTAYAMMAQAYASLDSTDKAIAAIETYKTLVTDTALLNGADRFLADIKQTKVK